MAKGRPAIKFEVVDLALKDEEGNPRTFIYTTKEMHEILTNLSPNESLYITKQEKEKN